MVWAMYGLWAIDWDPHKAIAIGEWSIYGGGRLESFTVYAFMHM